MKSPNDVVKKNSHRQPSTFDHETRCTAQKKNIVCLLLTFYIYFLKSSIVCDPQHTFCL